MITTDGGGLRWFAPAALEDGGLQQLAD